MHTFIPDGYGRRGYIKEAAGLHGALRFGYRPMLPTERNSVRAAINRERNSEKADALQSGAIAKQLTDWDAVYPDDMMDGTAGKPVPLSAVNVRHLAAPLYDRLYLIVSGMDASDPEPDATADEQTGYADLLLAADAVGSPPGDVQLAAQQKN